jgi:hypothetical protein
MLAGLLAAVSLSVSGPFTAGTAAAEEPLRVRISVTDRTSGERVDSVDAVLTLKATPHRSIRRIRRGRHDELMLSLVAPDQAGRLAMLEELAALV